MLFRSRIPCWHLARRGDRSGTLIRHAGLDSLTMPVVPLPVAMVQPSFRTLLVAAVGTASLLPPRLESAGRAAITLAAVTVGADPEHRVAPAANSLSENNFAMTRHPRCQVGLDNGERSWQGRSIFHRWLPDEGCPTGSRRRKRLDPATLPTVEDEGTPQQTPRMIDG